MADTPSEERPVDRDDLPVAEVAQVDGSDAADWLPSDEVRALLADRTNVVPVIGAGVSMAAGIEGVSGLCDHLRTHFNIHPGLGGEFSEPHNLFAVADEIVNQDFRIEARVLASAAQYFRDQLARWVPVEVTRDLVAVPSRLIVTLNYDLALEQTAEEMGVEVESWDGLHHVRQFTQLVCGDMTPDRLTVMHLHGTVADSRTMVLTHESYGRVGNDGDHQRLWESLVRDRRMALLGTSFNETYVLAALEAAIKRQGRRHPYFATALEIRRIRRSGRLVPMGVRHGIELIEIPSYDHLRGVIRYLVRPDSGPDAAATATPEPPEPPATPPPTSGPGYVPNVISEIGNDDDANASLRLGLWTDQSYTSEGALANEPRVLIVGVPGSGKSELLRFVAHLVGHSELPVFVRLTDVPSEAAAPSVQLGRWIARGQVLGADGWTAPNPQSIDGRSLHLFLDGLDEVSPREQHRVTSQIVGMATAFPQHSFTVASRPVESTAFFTDDWRRFSLTPGYVWQQRFLADRGIDLSELMADLGTGRDLNDLLHIPFFLSRIVDMRDEVAGLDVWGIVQHLISKALKDEHERNLLPVPEEPARRWLRELALAMALNGVTVIAFDELEGLKLPEGLVADPTDRQQILEICERLVSRAMLQKRHEGYAFAHRILGEALAAEALDERDPTDLLLNSIVPVASDEVRGVRADWRVPLTFLLLRNETWREAIKPRDALQWARTVPSNASLGDREEAANLIWSSYLEWRIWIWDYDLPDIIQDVTALARHLRGADLTELTSTLVVAVADPSPQVQGNAIRVLSQARVPGVEMEPLLREVLSDDGREAVVRRQAAVAADELGLVSLLPLIVERGSNPADGAEAQDASLVAMNMASDEQVFDVALALVAHRDTHSVVMSRISDRLSPRDMVRFLRGFAVLDDDPLSYERNLLAAALEQIGDADDDVVEDLAAISARWGLDGPGFSELFASHREAALRGALEAASDEEWSWHAYWVIDLFTSEELRTAGYPDDIVERRAHREAVLAQGPVQPVRPRRQPEPVQEKSLSLSELLAKPREEFDETIAHHSQFYRRQVEFLSAEEKADLAARLHDWWPDKPLAETITWKDRTANSASWTMENFAAAWLWFGPKLDLEPDPRQWSEMALSGVIFEEQLEWLRRHATPESARLVAELEADDARFWHEAISATPDPLPEVLIEAVAEKVRTSESPHHIEGLASRLAEAGADSALHKLAKNPDFAEAVHPHLARNGDAASLSALLDRLATDLQQNKVSDHESLSWLAGVGTDVRYLPALFEALIWASRLHRSEATRAASGFFFDLSPIMAAIQRIGGPEAIKGYDEVLANNEDLQFLRLQRSRIVEAEVAERGLKAAVEAGKEQGLPYAPG